MTSSHDVPVSAAGGLVLERKMGESKLAEISYTAPEMLTALLASERQIGRVRRPARLYRFGVPKSPMIRANLRIERSSGCL
jgi:hypothetical protein